jgi:hypothetical protein
MNIEHITPILNVSSMEESFEWFTKLGWKKLWDWGDPPTFGAVGHGKFEIFLCSNCQGSRGGPIRADGNYDTGGSWMSWWLASPAAVDDAHVLAVGLGYVVARPPFDAPWNVREFHLRHPDGHIFRVGAGLEEE